MNMVEGSRLKRILIVANVSSFLYKFERGDVRILQSLGL